MTGGDRKRMTRNHMTRTKMPMQSMLKALPLYTRTVMSPRMSSTFSCMVIS